MSNNNTQRASCAYYVQSRATQSCCNSCFTDEESGSEKLSNLSKVMEPTVKRAKLGFELRRSSSRAHTLSQPSRLFFFVA